MRLVFQKSPNTDPGVEADHLWTVVGQYHNDAEIDPDDPNGEFRLRSFGEGELAILHVDPKLLDEGDPTKKNALVDRVVVPEPPEPPPLKSELKDAQQS